MQLVVVVCGCACRVSVSSYHPHPHPHQQQQQQQQPLLLVCPNNGHLYCHYYLPLLQPLLPLLPRQDILRLDWLLECEAQRRLVPPMPRHYLFLCANTRALRRQEMDIFGDPYTEDVTAEVRTYTCIRACDLLWSVKLAWFCSAIFGFVVGLCGDDVGGRYSLYAAIAAMPPVSDVALAQKLCRCRRRRRQQQSSGSEAAAAKATGDCWSSLVCK